MQPPPPQSARNQMYGSASLSQSKKIAIFHAVSLRLIDRTVCLYAAICFTQYDFFEIDYALLQRYWTLNIQKLLTVL